MNVSQSQLKQDILEYFEIHFNDANVKSVKRYLRTKYSSNLKIDKQLIKQLAKQFKLSQPPQTHPPPYPPPHPPSIPTKKSKFKKLPVTKKNKKNKLNHQTTTELYQDLFDSPLKSIDIHNNPPHRHNYKQNQRDPSPSSVAVQYNDEFNEFKCLKCAKIFNGKTNKLLKFYTFNNESLYISHCRKHNNHPYNAYFCYFCDNFTFNNPNNLILHIKDKHGILTDNNAYNNKWKKPKTLRQKRPRQSQNQSQNQLNNTNQPSKRMKLSHNNGINNYKPHRRQHSLPFNLQHVKNLPSTKADINVQNVLKDVVNMNNNNNNNNNAMAYNHQNQSYHASNNGYNHQNHHTQHRHNNYTQNRNNYRNNDKYNERPHIVPFEAQYLHNIRSQFARLFDSNKTNHLAIGKSQQLKQILLQLHDIHPPPFYQMPVCNNLDAKYVLLQSEWMQLWIYGFTPFRQAIMETLSTTINVNYAALRHDVISFGLRATHPQSQVQTQSQVYNSNNNNNNGFYKQSGKNNNKFNNYVNNEVVCDEIEECNSFDDTPVEDPSLRNTETDINSICSKRSFNNNNNNNNNSAKHAQISPNQSYVIHTQQIQVEKAVKLKKKVTKSYPLYTPAFIPNKSNVNNMPILDIICTDTPAATPGCDGVIGVDKIDNFYADRFGVGDVIPLTNDKVLVLPEKINKTCVAVVEKKEIIKENLNDSMSMLVNDVNKNLVPKPMKIRQVEEGKKDLKKCNKRNVGYNYNSFNKNKNGYYNNRYGGYGARGRNRYYNNGGYSSNGNAYHYNYNVENKYKRNNRYYNEKSEKKEEEVVVKNRDKRRIHKRRKDHRRKSRKRKHRYSDYSSDYSSQDSDSDSDYSHYSPRRRRKHRYRDRDRDKSRKRRKRKDKYKNISSNNDEYNRHDRYNDKNTDKQHHDQEYVNGDTNNILQNNDRYDDKNILQNNDGKYNDKNTLTVDNDKKKDTNNDKISDYQQTNKQHQDQGYGNGDTYNISQNNNDKYDKHNADKSNRYNNNRYDDKTRQKEISEYHQQTNKYRKNDKIHQEKNKKHPIAPQQNDKPEKNDEIEEGELCDNNPDSVTPQNPFKINEIENNKPHSSPKKNNTQINPKQMDIDTPPQPEIQKINNNNNNIIQTKQMEIDRSITPKPLSLSVEPDNINNNNNININNNISNDSDSSSSDENLFDMVDNNLLSNKCNSNINDGNKSVKSPTYESLDTVAVGKLCDLLNPLLQTNHNDNIQENYNEKQYNNNNNKAISIMNTNTHTMSHFLNVSKTPHMKPIGGGKRNSPFNTKIHAKKPFTQHTQKAQIVKKCQPIHTKKTIKTKKNTNRNKDNNNPLLPPPPPPPLMLQIEDHTKNKNNIVDDDTFTRFCDGNDQSNSKINIAMSPPLKLKKESISKDSKPKPLVFASMDDNDSSSEDDSEDELLFTGNNDKNIIKNDGKDGEDDSEEELLFADVDEGNNGNSNKSTALLPNYNHPKNATNFGHFCGNK